MQIHCNIYGLMNASSGVECVIDRDLLEVGECFHYNDQDYVIVSVVESQGRWFANAAPENQRRFMSRPLSSRRTQQSVKDRETLQAWRERVAQAERKLQALREEQIDFGKRLDHLMYLLELLTKEAEGLQP
ncbi:hypothetical protein NKDENANG_02930 [Candidatus Entotheonellaceae bacterium PAL068K]